MENCVFCKIINGEIPSYTIYEDDDFKAVLDLSPATTGHALIIPKEHSSTLLELSDDRASKILIVAKKIIKAMQKVHGFTNYNLVQNNGRIAGQTIDHFHLHLIPRYSIEELSLWVPHDNDPSVNEALANQVRNAIE